MIVAHESVALAGFGGAVSLRVGVLADNATMPAWRAEAIRRVAAIDGAEIVVLVQPAPGPTPAAESGTSAGMDPGGLAWRAYLRSLPGVRHPARSPVMRPQSLAELAEVPRITAHTAIVGRFRERFTDASIAELRRYRPDILLRFAFGIIVGEVLTVPTYGVWSFHFGDELAYRGGPAAFWEVYEGADAAGVILQRLTERLDAGIILRKGWVPTVRTSYPRTWDAVHELAVDWPAAVCRDLVAGRVRAADGTPSRTTAPIRRRPGNGQMIAFGLKVLGRRLHSAVVRDAP
jgi:hypothetical protein